MTDDAVLTPETDGFPASLRVLRVRSQFLALNRQIRVPAKSFMLQARDRGDQDPVIGVGFTCSKKVGNAVARNRAKRRLREAARLVIPELGRPGWDYALIGWKDSTIIRPFEALLDDLRDALASAHKPGRRPGHGISPPRRR